MRSLPILSLLVSVLSPASAGHARIQAVHKGHREVKRHTQEKIPPPEKRQGNVSRFTYYHTGLGACGGYNSPNDLIVALNEYASFLLNPSCKPFSPILLLSNGTTVHTAISRLLSTLMDIQKLLLLLICVPSTRVPLVPSTFPAAFFPSGLTILRAKVSCMVIGGSAEDLNSRLRLIKSQRRRLSLLLLPPLHLLHHHLPRLAPHLPHRPLLPRLRPRVNQCRVPPRQRLPPPQQRALQLLHPTLRLHHRPHLHQQASFQMLNKSLLASVPSLPLPYPSRSKRQ